MAQLPNRGRHSGLPLRCMAPKNLQKENFFVSLAISVFLFFA
jgi:hypothetical protein